MSSSAYNCVKSQDLDLVAKVASSYKELAKVSNVIAAATKAGEHLKEAMQKTIRGESTLRSYGDVAAGITVFQDSQNVVVGIPDSSPLHPRALQMDQVYPVAEVVLDLTHQQGDTEAAFYDALAEILSR
jgi:hypothetical protein